MLPPELIQLLTASDLVDLRIDAIPKLQVGFRPGSLFSSFTSQDGEAKLTFTYIPHQILLNKDHEFFEDGDIHRHLYLQNLSTCPAYDSPTARQCGFRCHISGCSQVFSTVEDYEHHYNTLHRHVCSSCQRSLPSARLLDIHIQEWHDSLFSILAERQDMYQCLVEGCGLKYRTREQRKDHMIKIHKYPSDFMFDKAKRIKNIKIAKKNMLQKGTSMEVSMSIMILPQSPLSPSSPPQTNRDHSTTERDTPTGFLGRCVSARVLSKGSEVVAGGFRESLKVMSLRQDATLASVWSGVCFKNNIFDNKSCLFNSR
ncbi:zinc finger protein 511 isoform X3 [Salvelinus alpinus]|uniref:zinc finger protein 511 isoform X3 n=1 Tax=Salvelinus alpinus TaxID=8036 RepID=UPI0039FCA045